MHMYDRPPAHCVCPCSRGTCTSQTFCSSIILHTLLHWFWLLDPLPKIFACCRCDGPLLQLMLQSGKDTPPRTLYGVLATFGGIPLFNLSNPVQLVAAKPLNACAPLQQSQGMFVALHSWRTVCLAAWSCCSSSWIRSFIYTSSIIPKPCSHTCNCHVMQGMYT